VVNSAESEAPKKGFTWAATAPATQDRATGKCSARSERRQNPLGKTVQHAIPQTPVHLKNSFASETPITDGERVYACFGNVGIFFVRCRWQGSLDAQSRAAQDAMLRAGRIAGAARRAPLPIVSTTTSKAISSRSTNSPARNLAHAARREELRRSSGRTTSGRRSSPPAPARSAAHHLDGKALWSLKGMSSITIAMPFAADGLLYVTSGYVGDKMQTRLCDQARRERRHYASTLIRPAARIHRVVEQTIGPYNPSTLVTTAASSFSMTAARVSFYNAKTGEPVYERQTLPEGKSVHGFAVGRGRQDFASARMASALSCVPATSSSNSTPTRSPKTTCAWRLRRWSNPTAC
jgi:hypothetical protein